MNGSTLYKSLSRFFYSGGIVLLLTGMLLSMVSQPGYAATGPTPDPRLAAPPKGVIQPGKQAPKPDAPQTGNGAPVVVQPTRVVSSSGQGQSLPQPINKPVSKSAQTSRGPILPYTPIFAVAAPGDTLSLDFLCGYTQDPTINWRVYNKTTLPVAFSWAASDGSSGNGVAPASNQVIFATTKLGVSTTMRIYINTVLEATASSGLACKSYLTISYACIDGTALMNWYVTNPNPPPPAFPNDMVMQWSLDGGNFSPGQIIGGGQTILVTTSPVGVHTLTVNWTEPVFGPRTTSTTSNTEACLVITNTPTATAPATNTPTATATSTSTATATNTPTSTATNTPTGTLTDTPTSTATNRPTFTASPTASKTVPPPPPDQPTNTPDKSATPPPPPGNSPTITNTPDGGGPVIPVTGADLIGPGSITQLITLAGLLFIAIGLILSALIKRAQTK